MGNPALSRIFCFSLSCSNDYFYTMIIKLKKAIRSLTGTPQPGCMFVAVSGGIDSVVLSHMLHSAGFTICIAHVNFGLRAKESDDDERFVRDWAQQLGVACEVIRFDTKAEARKRKLSVQMAARELRYDWFNLLSEKNQNAFVAVAHQHDDELETFFINLLRGSGLHGLKGISERNGNIIRPLLFASRTEIEAYALKYHLLWRNDSSNQKNDYLRNTLRNRVLPQLFELASGKKGLLRSLSNLSENEKLFSELIEIQRKKLLGYQDQRWQINIAELKKVQQTEGMLFELLQPFGINSGQNSTLLAAIDRKGAFFLSREYRISVESETIEIQRRDAIAHSSVVLIHQPTTQIDFPIHLSFSKSILSHPFAPDKSMDKAWFDFDQLAFPLQVRRWQRADRFVPFGMNGSKLLSDFFTDQRFSRAQKENIWLLTDANNLILWVIGHRAAEICKVTSATQCLFTVYCLEK